MALLPQEPRKQQMLLAGMVPLLLFFVWYQFVRPARVVAIEEADARVEKVSGGNQVARAKIDNLGGQGIQAQVDLVQEHIRLLEGLMPGSEEVAGLIHRIAELTNEVGLNMGALDLAPTPGDSAAYYQRQVYELRVNGGYHQIGTLLARIGSLDRIIVPFELHLSRGAAAAPEGEADVTAAFKIQTFVVPPPAPLVRTEGGADGTP